MNIKAALKTLLAKREAGKPQAGIRFRISWPLLAALSLALVCAVGWAFFMGLMVGRGQNPQTSIQNMTGLGPSPEIEAQAPPAVLPEPLQAEAPTQAEPPSPASAPPASAKPAPAPKAAQPAKTPAQTKTAQAQQFDYTFQGGAFRTQKEAQSAQSRLNKNGVRSAVKKSGKVYLIVISLRGGRAEVQALQKKMKSLKMDKPMQLSKKPVETRKSGRNKG